MTKIKERVNGKEFCQIVQVIAISFCMPESTEQLSMLFFYGLVTIDYCNIDTKALQSVPVKDSPGFFNGIVSSPIKT